MANVFKLGACVGLTCGLLGCAAQPSGAPSAAVAASNPAHAPASSGERAPSAFQLYPAEPDIQLRLAQRFAEGDGVSRDLLASADWARRSASAGHAPALAWLEQQRTALAQYALFRVYSDRGPFHDPAKAAPFGAAAKEALAARAQANDSGAQYALGILLTYQAAEASAGQAWLERAARAGHVPAQRALAERLLAKEGSQAEEVRQAKGWLSKAAVAGDAEAELALGQLAESGRDAVKSEVLAAQHFSRAAALGLPVAERRLGQAYLNGVGLTKDPSAALYWLGLASDHGDDDAALNLSTIYRDGKLTAPNMSRSLELCTRAAKNGRAKAQVELGRRYRDGIGVPKDLSVSRTWFEKAAAQEDGDGEFYLALSYDGMGPDGDPKRATELYLRAAEHGVVSAETNLGALYASAKPEPDYAAALTWYRRGADHGDATAQRGLGLAYREGNGVPKDPALARTWFQRAADAGDTNAMTDVGESFESGDGVTRDLGRARQWYERAAEKGNANAQVHLGHLYEDGLGVEKSLSLAIYRFRQAADQNDSNGALQLGRLLRFSAASERDDTEGCRQLLIAAKAGHSGAQYGIGACLESGVGVERDDAAAAYWFGEGAKQSHAGCEYELGLAYAEGRGLVKDEAAAEHWLAKAVADGDKDAPSALASLRERLACTRRAKTELFGAKLLCVNRRDLRFVLASQRIQATSESDERWSDSYEASALLDEASTIELWYTRDNAWLARATYEFPSSLDIDQVVRVALLVSRKYGVPSSRRGDPRLGPMRYEWSLADGVRLAVHRGWPDSTTYLDYEIPKRLSQMNGEIAADEQATRRRRATEQNGAF